MRALVASAAISLLLLAGCGDDDAPVTAGTDPTTTSAPPAFAPDALVVDHPCGRGFQVGSLDQQVALVFRPSDDEPPAAGAHVLPGGSWTGTVRLGQDLFANWCDDVLEPGEPTPEVLEEWPVAEGSIDVVLPPDGAWGPATLTASGLVAERPDGERIVIGDITIENSNHGLVPG